MDERDVYNDPQSTKRVPIQRDGAAYIPSGQMPEPDDMAMTKKIPTTAQRGDGAKKTVKKRKEPKRAHYAVFLVTTVFVGILAAVFTFALMFNEFFDGDIGFGGGATPGQNLGLVDLMPDYELPPIEEMITAPGAIITVGIVQDINPASNRIDLYVFEDSRIRSFFAEGRSVLRDKFNIAVTSIANFNVGDVLEVAYMAGSTTIETARVSPQVTPFPRIQGVVIDVDNQELLIGMTRYSFSPHTIVRYRGTPMSITEIDPVDVVSIDVFGNKAVFIDVYRGNGILHIPRNARIIQGVVEIGVATTPMFINLEDDDMDIRVAEGEHLVTIRGANIEAFQQNVTVERGGRTTFDFTGLELRAGSLTVNIEDPLATLSIDGQFRTTNQPIDLEFGTHRIVVERVGYIPFEQEITIGNEPVEITVRLEELVLTRNVIITTSPPGARVYLDGGYVGMSPVAVYLELRRYTLNLALDGFIGVGLDIWITEDSPPAFQFPMVPLPVVPDTIEIAPVYFD